MTKDVSLKNSVEKLVDDGLNLPSFEGILERTLNEGKLLPVAGTNVVRVPFGVREPRRKRPQHPNRLTTLILPFQCGSSPTPPPHAA